MLTAITILGITANAQLSGTKNIPGDYADLAAAITDLNTQGVGAGGVILNVVAANPQTAPSGGYNITATGTLANPITITGNSNIVTAFAGQTAGNLNDAIFKLIGSDYVTIQGFTMREDAANTTIAAATNNMTEWGIALLYASLTDGAQNNTIQNNNISLNRTYFNTFGIYSNTRHSATAVTTTAEVTAASGSNSGNKVYGNTISNVNYGITFVGAGTTLAAIDNGNDIGGTSIATGNTLTDWGGGSPLSGYVSVTTSNTGIYLNQQINDNASYNSLTSAAGLATTTIQHNGVIKAYSVASPAVGTVTTSNLNNNSVNLINSPTTGQMTGVSAQGMTALSTATINMNNNLVTGAIQGTLATSAAFVAIFGTSAPGTFNINGNTVRGVTTNSTTGGFIGVQQQTNGVVNALNINNNKIGDATLGSVTFSNATNSGSVGGIIVTSTGASATCAVSITGNDIRGIVNTTTGTGTQTYFSNAAIVPTLTMSSNTFTNLSINSTGTITFLLETYSATATGVKNVNNNSIVTGFARTGTSGSLLLVSDNGSSVTGSVSNCQNNNFSNITLTGTASITGLNFTDGGTSPAKNFTGNTFNNWTVGTGAVNVMNITYLNGVSTLSNNTITNINGQAAITGITLGSSASNATSVAVANNTINNLSSTGTGGNVIGITCSNTSAGISINNNAINTLSTTGATVTGINITGASTTNVFKNNIFNLSSANTTPGVNGIALGGGTNVNAANNFISDLRAPNANAAVPIYGINNSGGTNIGIYYNTIALGKAATLNSAGALFGVTGIGYSSSSNVTLRNNIVWIDATPAGTGTIAAIRRSAAGTAGTAPSGTNFNSNNNIYQVLLTAGAPPVAANINKYLYLEGTISTTATNGFGIDIGQADVPVQNLKSDPNFNSACGLYKTFMGTRDGGSFNENNLTASGGPAYTFVPTGSSYASNSAQVMTSPSITDDYSGVSRSATTPDMGALEFAGPSIDATPPAISFTALPNTVCFTAPILAATISDASGVNVTPGLAPRLYYRKGGAAAEADVFLNYPAENNASFNGWKYVEATGSEPNFSFAIDYSKLTSPMVLGDSLTYFVIAQDNNGTPNVGKNKVTFPLTYCPSSVTVPTTGAVPTSASWGYNITPYLPTYTNSTAGNYQVGTSNAQKAYINISGSAACPANVTTITFNTGTSTAPAADITQAKCYYTTTSTFSSATPFGSAIPAPNGAIVFTGTQLLANGTGNYFWLVYDISCSATPGDSVNATVTNMVVGGNTYVPTGTGYSRHAVSATVVGDNITSAATLVLGPAATNSYAVSGRSLESGEPSPIQNGQGGGSSGQSNYSWGSTAGGTYWYKLVVPTSGYGSSGNLVILADTSTGATSADNQIALWEFPNMPSGCGLAPNFSGGRLLQANDDRIENGQFFAPGETVVAGLNSLIRVRLVPGNTYYLQIDGYTTAIPFGNIYVYDLAQAPYSFANNGLGNFFNPKTTNTMRFAAYEVDGADGWTYYYDNNATSTTLADDSVLLAIRWDANTNYYYNGTYLTGTEMVNHIKGSARSASTPSILGTFTTADSLVVWSGRNAAALASVDLKPTAPYVTANKWWMINKYWSVLPFKQPGAVDSVRFFYSDADYNALVTNVTAGGGTLTSHSDMQFIKATKSPSTHYTNAELDPGAAVNPHSALLAGTVTNSIPWTNTDAVETGADNINQAQFAVTTFSGGGGGSTGSNFLPIPVKVEYFRGTKQAANHLLDWKVSCSNTQYATLTLELSADGRNFSSIYSIRETALRCQQPFSYTNINPLKGINYYRLKMVDDNGVVAYSSVVALINASKGLEFVNITPNPVAADGRFKLNIASAEKVKMEIIIADVAGRIMVKQSSSLISGFNAIDMNVSNLASGVYQVFGNTADGKTRVLQFVKQ